MALVALSGGTRQGGEAFIVEVVGFAQAMKRTYVIVESSFCLLLMLSQCVDHVLKDCCIDNGVGIAQALNRMFLVVRCTFFFCFLQTYSTCVLGSGIDLL